MENKEYYFCPACDSYVYRIPGHTHGDGHRHPEHTHSAPAREGEKDVKNMEYACNEEKGLLAVSLDGTPETTWKFARCKYDGRLGCYKPDSALPISDYCVFLTRRLATEKAKSLCFPANRVEKLGNKFGVGWGIRHDIRDNYFLAVFD